MSTKYKELSTLNFSSILIIEALVLIIIIITTTPSIIESATLVVLTSYTRSVFNFLVYSREILIKDL